MRSDTLRARLTGLLMANLTGCDRHNDPLSAIGTLAWGRIELSAAVSEPIIAIETLRDAHFVRTDSRNARAVDLHGGDAHPGDAALSQATGSMRHAVWIRASIKTFPTLIEPHPH